MSLVKIVEVKFKFFLIRVIAPAILNGMFFFIPRKEKTLLLVRSDGVGDYILFRNYLDFLKSSSKYKQYKIYVLENFICKDLATYWDSEIVEQFFWHSDSYFLKWELAKLLWKLQQLRTETIIYTSYSRTFSVDWLISKVRAKHKIAVDGDCINESPAIKSRCNQYYGELISVNADPLHEFDRNKQIFEILTQEKCPFEKPFIGRHKLILAPNHSIVVFAGAGHQNKRWGAPNFNKLCLRLIIELKAHVILAGSKDDSNQEMVIRDGIPGEWLTYQTGQNMIGLCELIGGADLLISGDTAAIHIAALLGKPAICIAKGDLYGRFIPYPPRISEQITCVFPRSYLPKYENYDQWSEFSINDVMVNDVFDASAKILTSLILNKN